QARGRIASPLVPYLVLLRVGFALPPPLPMARCALTAPFHPCCRTEARRRYVFCGTFRRLRLNAASRTLSGTLLYGVRTFLPAHVATNGATVRPACLPEYYRCFEKAGDSVAFRAPSHALGRARIFCCPRPSTYVLGYSLCRPLRGLDFLVCRCVPKP